MYSGESQQFLYLVVTPHLLALDSHTDELHWSYSHESIHDHPLYQIITLCKDIFRTCFFNKERGKKCRATT